MFSGKEKSKILLVDDEPGNIRALSRAIDAGHDVHFSNSGKETLELIQKKQFDLILLDIIMPDIDGFKVFHKIKSLANSLNVDTPVIFITSSITENDEIKGLQMGAVDYISKPFHPAVIQVRVRNHLRTKKMHDLLSKQSLHDELTKLPNRRFFEQQFNDEWNRALRYKFPLSLIMIDIDYFKNYNDEYGHLEGDICLKQVAQQLLLKLERASDFIARYGGEEFVCLLPDTDIEASKVMAEKLRQSIIDLKIPHSKSLAARHLTISLGLASVIPEKKLKITDLIHTADKNLYLAKKRGRNSVMMDELFPITDKPDSLNFSLF